MFCVRKQCRWGQRFEPTLRSREVLLCCEIFKGPAMAGQNPSWGLDFSAAFKDSEVPFFNMYPLTDCEFDAWQKVQNKMLMGKTSTQSCGWNCAVLPKTHGWFVKWLFDTRWETLSDSGKSPQVGGARKTAGIIRQCLSAQGDGSEEQCLWLCLQGSVGAPKLKSPPHTVLFWVRVFL